MKHKLSVIYLIPITLAFVLFFLEGCVTTGKTTYLQELEAMTYEYDSIFYETYKLQKSDNIFIKVVTPDNRYADMFNTIPVGSSSGSTTEQSIDLLSYDVQADGTVSVPYLGPVQVGGLTLAETTDLLTKELTEYVGEVYVTVKLVNYYVSILGEVTIPGRYPVYKQHLNIFQALAMAGDIDDFGNRFQVKIIRPTPQGSVVKEFDLTDDSILDSEFYFVMPNDVIYVEPMKGKFFAMNEFPFGIILSAISTTILILSFIQN